MSEVGKQMLNYGKHPKMVALTKELSEISKGTERVGFAITYSSTQGNLDIHERFLNFCADKSNNEYLAGIGKLLDYSEFMMAWLDHEKRLQALEQTDVKKIVTTEEVKKEEKVIKTIGD